MEELARSYGAALPAPIDLVADDGMPNVGEVHTQLMRSSRLRDELHIALFTCLMERDEVCDGLSTSRNNSHFLPILRMALQGKRDCLLFGMA